MKLQDIIIRFDYKCKNKDILPLLKQKMCNPYKYENILKHIDNIYTCDRFNSIHKSNYKYAKIKQLIWIVKYLDNKLEIYRIYNVKNLSIKLDFNSMKICHKDNIIEIIYMYICFSSDLSISIN
jgi:hypothetical protein